MDISLEKTLPSNLEAERLLIGAILMDNAVPTDVKVSDLYLDQHRRILESMISLSESNEPINVLSVKNALQNKNQLEAIGGAAYLASLTDGLPNLELAPQYIRIIRRDSALRRLIQMGNETMARGYGAEEEPQDIINSVLDACDEASGICDSEKGLRPISDYIGPVFQNIEARANNQVSDAYSTGFVDLDKMLSGGVRSTDQFVLAARPGNGKTALAMNMAINLGIKGIDTAVFSLEMGAHQIIERMISQIGRIDYQRMRSGFLNREDWRKISTAAGELSELPIYIDDSTGVTVADIRSRIRKLRPKSGGKIQVNIIDYLQLINPPERLRRNADDNSVTSAISKALKALAKNLDVAQIVISQLSRASEKRTDRRPQLSDLRNSGQIEQDADVVVFIQRQEMGDPTEENAGLADLIIAKQRNGPTGEIRLAFSKEYMRFDSLYSEG